MKPSNLYKNSGRDEVNKHIESNILSLFQVYDTSKNGMAITEIQAKETRGADYDILQIENVLNKSGFFSKKRELYYLVN